MAMNSSTKQTQVVDMDSDSFLSIHGCSEESSVLGACGGKNDERYETISETSFNRDSDVKDLCAICFASQRKAKRATHFCVECGVLGHFLCRTCLDYHQHLTNHSKVKSFAAAKYRSSTDLSKMGNRETVDDLHAKLADAKEENERIQLEKETLEMKFLQDQEKCQKNYSDDAAKQNETIKKLRRSVSKKDQKIQQLEESISNLTKENNAVIDELTIRIKFGENPNITDLGSKHHTVSEYLCDLWNNEWKDAYEEMEHVVKTEKEAIRNLYMSLLNIYEFCKTRSEEHEKIIHECVLTRTYGRPISAEAYVTGPQPMISLRRYFAPYLEDNLNINIKKKVIDADNKTTETFLKKCVDICLLMNSQDPPVVFDTSEVEGKAFDSDKFNSFTKIGKIVDYVVWPPVLQHKDLLCKGVAQGK